MSDPFLRRPDGFPASSAGRRPPLGELREAPSPYRLQPAADAPGPLTRAALEHPAPPFEAGTRFATTYPLDHPALLEDLHAAARYGAMIEDAAATSGLLPAVIVALGSRESRWGQALTPHGPSGSADFVPRPEGQPHRRAALPPDGDGFRRGLLQVDYDAHAFARIGPWRAPRANIVHGSRALAEIRTMLRRRTLLGATGLLRAALAAWNCGVGEVMRALRLALDVDFSTTDGDYSRDVLSRAGFFQAHGWD